MADGGWRTAFEAFKWTIFENNASERNLLLRVRVRVHTADNKMCDTLMRLFGATRAAT